MRLPHEQVQATIESFESGIIQLKRQLKDPIWQRKAGVIWEVDRDLNLSCLSGYFWTSSDDEQIRIHFHKAVPVDAFNDFFDEIETCFDEHGFIMSMEPAVTYGNESKYYFEDKDGLRLSITIASGVCKQVNTGRMVPETKTDCGFLEDV